MIAHTRFGAWKRGPALLLVVVVALALGFSLWLTVDLPSPDQIEESTLAPSSILYDHNGRQLYEIMDPRTGRHQPLPLAEIPLALRQATVATEDASFYSNPGVDAFSIVRALWINLRGGQILSGGSTITQQLARNLLLSKKERSERTLLRKIRESVLAYRLARTMSKDRILELYLNQIYYGHVSYGVEAAAQSFFGRSVRELNLAQCALLAGLPQAPALYDPLMHPDAALRRRRAVLELMAHNGMITPEESVQAADEPLVLATAAFPIRAPHFVMYVWEQLREQFGDEAIFAGGLRVFTTLDVELQERAQSIAAEHLRALNTASEGTPGHNVTNASVVALNPSDGSILVMLGSVDYFDASIDGAVNVALMPRQPGSAMKPLTYALALSRGFTAGTMLLDVPSAFLTKDGGAYRPQNYDRTYRGPVLLRQALACSLNVPAVEVLQKVGVAELIALAQQAGITTLDQADRFGLALTLGGGEVRLLELTAALAALANTGLRVQPSAILRVEDASGKELWSRPTPGKVRILDENVAYLISDMLSDDMARLPAFGEGSALSLSRPAAAKTGTTGDWRDNWTIGYTPDLCIGVWVGNSDNSPMRDVSGISGAAPIWHDIMEEALQGTPPAGFRRPEGLMEVTICSVSGQLASAYCTRVRQELFVQGSNPTETCAVHRLVTLDRRTRRPADPNSDVSTTVQRVCTVLPASAAEWIMDQGPQDSVCYCTDDQVQTATESRPASPQLLLVSPQPDQVFRLSPLIPQSDQRLELRAVPIGLGELRQVAFYVDGQELATLSDPPYATLWVLAPGQHSMYASAVAVDRTSWTSMVVSVSVQP
jgi:1A family penicillin-binding protein